MTINKEKMVTYTSIKKVDPSFIDSSQIEGSQINALNASKGQCSVTNKDCINSSYSSISSENELSLEDSSTFHSSSTYHQLSSYRIPSIIEIPSSFAPTLEEFYSTHNNGVNSGALSKE